MTFTEAAEAVLRKVGRALHYKKITAIALEEGLLSHTGRAPETTMSTRLAMLTQKDRGDSAIVRVRPGVFALREWGANFTVDADAESDPHTNAGAVDARREEAPSRTTSPSPAHTRSGERNAPPPQEARRGEGHRNDNRRGEGHRNDNRRGEGHRNDNRRGEGHRNDNRRGGRRETPVAEVSTVTPHGDRSLADIPERSASTPPSVSEPTEMPNSLLPTEHPPEHLQADDTTKAPVREKTETDRGVLEVSLRSMHEASSTLGTPTDPSSAGEPPPRLAASSTPPDDMEAGEELAPAREQVAPAPTPARIAEPEDDEDAPPRDAAEIEREERLAASAGMYPEEDDDEEPLLGATSTDRDRGAGRRRRRRRRGRDGTPENTSASAVERPAGDGVEPHTTEHRDREPRKDEDTPRETETGRDAADLLVSLLTRREDRQPVPMRSLVDEAIRNGRLTGDALFHVPALTAAARMDTVRRAKRGERARLRVAGGRVGLVDWTLPGELVRAEADALAALERLRETARRYVVRRLNELPQASFTEVLVMLLERLGISSFKTVRRPGLPPGEIHLSGMSRRGPEELPVAVVIRRSGEIGRERVIELRGSLHHYNNAAIGWIVTTGTVFSGAREEAAQPDAAPITLIDANVLGRMMDEQGVLVTHASMTIPWLDIDLYDALRGG